jgi:hypothetical protein
MTISENIRHRLRIARAASQSWIQLDAVTAEQIAQIIEQHEAKP